MCGTNINVFNTQIPKAIKAAETSMHGKSIYAYQPNSVVAQAYTNLTREVLNLEQREIKRDAVEQFR